MVGQIIRMSRTIRSVNGIIVRSLITARARFPFKPHRDRIQPHLLRLFVTQFAAT